MSLNQTLTITTMYQTHNNNNYPKHNTIAININKVNKINTVFDCSPSNVLPLKSYMNLKNFSPFLIRMAKGSLLMMCGDAIKFCCENIKLVLHGYYPLRLLGLDLSVSIKSFQDDLKCIWRYI